MVRLAIIGGTGFEDPARLGEGWTHRRLETRFGPAEVSLARIGGQELAFLSRHGRGHALAPHRINYLANIEALRQLGVRRVAATAAVGSLRADLTPGSLVVLDQFIDMTRRRPDTLFEEGPVAHTDFTEPYCPEIRRALLEAARELGLPVIDGGCYVGVDGPRYETPAEVRALRILGGDVVGMTGLPEAVLAREAGLCYAAVAVVSNLGAGLAAGPLSHEEVSRAVAAVRPKVTELLLQALLRLPEARTCRCSVLN